MRLRNCAALFLGALVFFAATTQPICAAQADTPAPAPCGKTVADNLAAAQKAIQSNNAAMHSALVCLIEATGTLNNQVQTITAGRDASGALNVPSAVTPCNWAGANGCR
jgi:hypothetical protein